MFFEAVQYSLWNYNVLGLVMEIHFHGYTFQLLGALIAFWGRLFILMGMNDGGEKWEFIGLLRVVILQNKNYYIFGVQGRTPNRGRFKGRHAFSTFVPNFQSRYETFQTYNLLKLYLSSKYGKISECKVKV